MAATVRKRVHSALTASGTSYVVLTLVRESGAPASHRVLEAGRPAVSWCQRFDLASASGVPDKQCAHGAPPRGWPAVPRSAGGSGIGHSPTSSARAFYDARATAPLAITVSLTDSWRPSHGPTAWLGQFLADWLMIILLFQPSRRGGSLIEPDAS